MLYSSRRAGALLWCAAGGMPAQSGIEDSGTDITVPWCNVDQIISFLK